MSQTDERSQEAPGNVPPAVGRAKRAALWTVIGFIVLQVLRLGSNIILARLLAPQVFGLMALVSVFIQGLHMFSDVGLGPGIVQSKRGDERDFLNTAWTVQIVRGFGLWFASLLIAWPVSIFYDEPLFLWLIPAVGLHEVLTGFNSTAMVTLGRRLYRGRLVLLEIATYAGSISFVILWVYHWHSVWPLVVGTLVASLIQLGFSHLLLPGFRNRFCWDRAAVAELLHFGKWIFIGTLFTFLASQLDRLVVGKLSLGLLGVYHFGAMLAGMPAQLMYALQGQLLFPLYSRHHQEGWGLYDVYSRFHLAAAGLTAVLLSGLIAAGPTLVRVLYDPRYSQAGWMLQILAIGVWFQALEAANGAVLWALGRPQTSAFSNAAKVVALAILAPLGYWLADLPGLIVGFVAGDLVRYLLTVRVVRREGLPCIRYDAVLTLFIVGTSLMTLYVAPELRPYRLRPEALAVFAATPEAAFPATLPWVPLLHMHQKDWANDLIRLGIEGALVVLPWLIAAAAGWRLGLFRQAQTAKME